MFLTKLDNGRERKNQTQESPTQKKEVKNGGVAWKGNKQPSQVCGHSQSQVISTLDQNEGGEEGRPIMVTAA